VWDSREICVSVLFRWRENRSPFWARKKGKKIGAVQLSDKKEKKRNKVSFFFSLSGAPGAKWEEAKGMGSITPRAPRDSHRVASCCLQARSRLFFVVISCLGPGIFRVPPTATFAS
jgi:hypothetical protein